MDDLFWSLLVLFIAGAVALLGCAALIGIAYADIGAAVEPDEREVAWHEFLMVCCRFVAKLLIFGVVTISFLSRLSVQIQRWLFVHPPFLNFMAAAALLVLAGVAFAELPFRHRFLLRYGTMPRTEARLKGRGE